MAPVTPFEPILENGRDVLNDAKYWGFRVMGRIRAGAADERVRTETEALLRQALPADLVASDPAQVPRVIVSPGGQGLDSLRRNYSQPLYLLLWIMAVVLLIGCANVAGLLLMRNAARQRELAVRLSLGAGRGRLIRQLLTESVLLAGVGGALGLVLALGARDGLLPLLNQDDPPITIALGYGPRLWGFATALCLFVGLLFGILPALRATRVGISPGLMRTMPGNATISSRLLAGKTLIAFQVALSLVLVAGAGLFTRTLLNLRSEPLGFRSDHLLLFQIDGTASSYSGERLLNLYERVLERMNALPGVSAASFSRYGLLTGGATRDSITVPGLPKGQDQIGVYLHFISPRYFETMGIPLVAGRDVELQDREKTPPVAVANEALVQQLPGGGSGVGQRINYDRNSGLEIVGVVGDARFASLREPAPPTLYLPYRQYRQNRMTFALRVAGDPAAVAPSVRRVIEEIDRSVPPYDVRTQEEQINMAIRKERLFAYVGSGFALLAVALASLGIYGTLAYSVARRTPEIGLRMALGASRREVVVMVIRESLAPVIAGVVIGLGVALETSQFLKSMLFGLEPNDTFTLAVAVVGLIASALLAAWLPSRRASGVDPTTALRCD
jgi:predicted permease